MAPIIFPERNRFTLPAVLMEPKAGEGEMGMTKTGGKELGFQRVGSVVGNSKREGFLRQHSWLTK